MNNAEIALVWGKIAESGLHEVADIPGLKNVFRPEATIAGSHIVEITYIPSKKKRRGISGKKIRYCLRYRNGIAK